MSRKPLSPEEYQANLCTLWVAAHAIAEMPIPEMIAAGGHAGDFGPLMNPTLWREKHAQLEQDLQMLRAMNGVRTEMLRMAELARRRAERAQPTERAA